MKEILLRRFEFGSWNTHNRYHICRVPFCYLYLEVNNLLHEDSIQIVKYLSGNECDCNNEYNTISCRKKPLKQKVKRMRQLSSTFFRRKRERLREAKQHKSKSPESRQNNVQNQSNVSLIPLDGLGDGARKEKVKQKIDCVNNRDRDNPSFILTESKTDPTYVTMERIIPQDGMKSQANNDNCFKTDIVQVHVNDEEHPEFKASEDFKAESKYLTLDRIVPEDIVKMDRNCYNSKNNKNDVVSLTSDSVLEDRHADLTCDNDRKTSPCTNSDERTEIFMHESTSDMGGRRATVDIESDLQSTEGQANDSCNKFDEIRDLAIEVRERDSDETDNCLQSLHVRHETDECSAHAGANGEMPESDQLQGHQCKHCQRDITPGNSEAARHNNKKGSKSKREDGNGKQCSGSPSQVSTEEVKGNVDEEATSTNKSEINILNSQHCSKETIEQSDENCLTSKEVSTIRLHRQAFRRKHNSEPALSVSHKDVVLSSQTEHRTNSERHDITDKDTNNSMDDHLRELQRAETKDNSFQKLTRNQRPETVCNGKNKYRKRAVRRKSPLEFKTSDESGYASSVSDRDRHISETSNISVEIISEEESR